VVPDVLKTVGPSPRHVSKQFRAAASGSSTAVEGYSVLHLMHWLLLLNCIILEGEGTVIL